MSKCKTLGIISIKGGVGKTTTVINLAASLANDYRKKVLVVDANFSSPNVNLHLGSVDHKTNLHDVLKNKANIANAVYDHEFGFHFIPSALIVNEKVNYLSLKHKLAGLKKYYDFIVIDSSPSLNDEILATISASDELYVVSSPDLPTLSTTLRAAKLAKQKGARIEGLILNKVRGKKYEIPKKDMEELTGIPVLTVINDNPRVLESLSKVKPITLHSPNSNVSREYKRLAAALCGENYKEPSLLVKAAAYLKDDFNNFVSHDFKKNFKYY